MNMSNARQQTKKYLQTIEHLTFLLTVFVLLTKATRFGIATYTQNQELGEENSHHIQVTQF
ncbi:MAG: hypothetical protein COA94_07760 [Rickettsiales bacterium]|nr:MAG: hypothetical protein COA94_07760 [Rickettsiales bacterium]